MGQVEISELFEDGSGSDTNVFKQLVESDSPVEACIGEMTLSLLDMLREHEGPELWASHSDGGPWLQYSTDEGDSTLITFHVECQVSEPLDNDFAPFHFQLTSQFPSPGVRSIPLEAKTQSLETACKFVLDAIEAD